MGFFVFFFFHLFGFHALKFVFKRLPKYVTHVWLFYAYKKLSTSLFVSVWAVIMLTCAVSNWRLLQKVKSNQNKTLNLFFCCCRKSYLHIPFPKLKVNFISFVDISRFVWVCGLYRMHYQVWQYRVRHYQVWQYKVRNRLWITSR